MREHIDTVTNPNVTIPIVATSTFLTSFMDNLPIMMSVGSFIYLVLLIVHKVYTMYKDFKEDEQHKE